MTSRVGERPRRPGSGGRSALRRSERAQGPARRSSTTPPRPSVGLTTRAAALGLVLCALVVSAALPLREYLAQRGRIAEAAQTLAVQRSRVGALEQQRALLDDPTYVASLARERLHFVKPGEMTYVVLGAEPASPSGAPGAVPAPVGPEAPWWSQLYGTARTADRAAP